VNARKREVILNEVDTAEDKGESRNIPREKWTGEREEQKGEDKQ